MLSCNLQGEVSSIYPLLLPINYGPLWSFTHLHQALKDSLQHLKIHMPILAVGSHQMEIFTSKKCFKPSMIPLKTRSSKGHRRTLPSFPQTHVFQAHHFQVLVLLLWGIPRWKGTPGHWGSAPRTLECYKSFRNVSRQNARSHASNPPLNGMHASRVLKVSSAHWISNKPCGICCWVSHPLEWAATWSIQRSWKNISGHDLASFGLFYAVPQIRHVLVCADIWFTKLFQ